MLQRSWRGALWRCLAGPVVVALLLLGTACHRTSSSRDLLDRAIAAHGGRENLKHLDNLKVISTVRFKDQVTFRRTIHWMAPDAWSMQLDVNDMPAMSFGMNGTYCWRKDRQLVRPCAPDDTEENGNTTKVLNARFLHHLDPSHLQPGGTVDVDGRACPTLRWEKLTLVFDRETSRLIQVRGDNWIESYSDFRTIAGALVAARRVLTIGGDLDVDELWSEMTPGGALAAGTAPRMMKDGLFVEDKDLPRDVAWTEVADLEDAARTAMKALDAFAVAHGRTVSANDGVLITEVPVAGQPSRWRLATGLEFLQDAPPIHEGALHLERWPASTVVGVFHQGDPRQPADKLASLQKRLDERGQVRVPGTALEILSYRDMLDRPPVERLSLLRLQVKPR